jgi:hypothetical protein
MVSKKRSAKKPLMVSGLCCMVALGIAGGIEAQNITPTAQVSKPIAKEIAPPKQAKPTDIKDVYQAYVEGAPNKSTAIEGIKLQYDLPTQQKKAAQMELAAQWRMKMEEIENEKKSPKVDSSLEAAAAPQLNQQVFFPKNSAPFEDAKADLEPNIDMNAISLVGISMFANKVTANLKYGEKSFAVKNGAVILGKVKVRIKGRDVSLCQDDKCQAVYL